jgi:2-polyprenyl-3-methyl-5-hydroxy-6-metoxy-1,4-benzoquinol methylase
MIANYLINKEIEKSKVILDVGCGKGIWRTNNFIIGIDILKQKVNIM